MRGETQRIYIIRPTVTNIRLIIGHVTAALAHQRNSPDALPLKVGRGLRGIFRCAVASLYEVVSVRPSVRMSRVIFKGEKNAY